MTVVLNVETRNAVAGYRRHGAIYPIVSTTRIDAVREKGEDIEPVYYRKITIEDGQFSQASRRIGYTGQHTDLRMPQDVHEITDGVYELKTDVLTGSLFSRNEYGSTRREFRLDLVRGKLQRPVTRKGITKWYDFKPSQYLD
jgi:hypothetical protein